MLLRELVDKITNKSIILVGSGPNPIMPKSIDSNSTIICLKASAYSAKDILPRHPDITFQGAWGLNDNLKYLQNLKTDILIQTFFYKKGWQYDNFIAEYKKINYYYNKLFLMDDEHLDIFYQSDIWVGKQISNNPMSFGVGVLLICLQFKAKDITLVGFSPDILKRNYECVRLVNPIHKEVDCQIIDIVSQNFKNIYTTNKSLSEKITDLKYKE